jgi:hypothetical protein
MQTHNQLKYLSVILSSRIKKKHHGLVVAIAILILTGHQDDPSCDILIRGKFLGAIRF